MKTQIRCVKDEVKFQAVDQFGSSAFTIITSLPGIISDFSYSVTWVLGKKTVTEVSDRTFLRVCLCHQHWERKETGHTEELSCNEGHDSCSQSPGSCVLHGEGPNGLGFHCSHPHQPLVVAVLGCLFCQVILLDLTTHHQKLG